MRIELVQHLGSARDPVHARHLMREYLQARILASLQRAGAMVPLAFHGGTALRFLFNLPRFSEDLDFALERSPELYDFRAFSRAIRSDLTAENYPVEIKVSEQRVVQSALIRFRGLFYDLNLSPHADETLSIKVDVDTQPPAGAELATTMVRRHRLLNLHHHDRASLLAGKLHAILQRPYLKGRDLYDLFWYLSTPDWPAPNLRLLNHALAQTGWRGGMVTVENWRAVIGERLEKIDWASMVDDVRPFLMEPESANLMTRETVARLLDH